jgi:hypothetical protein
MTFLPRSLRILRPHMLRKIFRFACMFRSYFPHFVEQPGTEIAFLAAESSAEQDHGNTSAAIPRRFSRASQNFVGAGGTEQFFLLQLDREGVRLAGLEGDVSHRSSISSAQQSHRNISNFSLNSALGALQIPS